MLKINPQQRTIVLLLVTTMSLPALANNLQNQSESAPSSKWLLDFAGKSTNSVAADPRLLPLLRAGLPDTHGTSLSKVPLADAASTYLGGAPETVSVQSQRFVTSAACVPHDGWDRGLLWVDTGEEDTMIFGALSVEPGQTDTASLALFTRDDAALSTLPPQFLSALNRWLDKHKITRITKTTITGPDGHTSVLPSDILGRA